MTESRMYTVEGKTVRTWNVFKGCKFGCIYCVQREQAKRQKHRCEKCYNYDPHMHSERLDEKFKAGETVFVAAAGDISFMHGKADQIAVMDVMRKYKDTTFLLQTKDPHYYLRLLRFGDFPDNVILGTTIETNEYPRMLISEAPYPIFRKHALHQVEHKRKYITIEPILKFNVNVFVEWIKEIAPEFVYVGYLNHMWKAKKLQIQEPSLEETEHLIEQLEKLTNVRRKTIRKSWSE